MDPVTIEMRLHGGLFFSAIGLGTAPLGNLGRVLSEQEAQATLRAAWKLGVTYFDTAPLYGHGLSETRLRPLLAEQPREGFVVSTKVGRVLEACEPGQEMSGKFLKTPPYRFRYDYSYDCVMLTYESSLRRLGLDSIDILLIHDVDAYTHGTVEESEARIDEVMDGGYKALDELRANDEVQLIGAGVNQWEPCMKLAERGDFDLFLLAGRYTLLEQSALDEFLPMCLDRGIGVIIGGPYNSGILARGPVDGATYNYEPAPDAVLDRVAAIERVCQAHDVAMADAALAFPLAHPAVLSVIPGGQSPEEVRRNMSALNAVIPAAFWSDLKSEGLLRADAPVPED